MLSNFLRNSVTCTMSHRNVSSSPRKKQSKDSSDSLRNSRDKLKSAASSTSRIDETEEEAEKQRPDLSQNSNTGSSSSRTTAKSRETIVERETMNTSFSGKALWCNGGKLPNDATGVLKSSASTTLRRDGELIGMLSKQLYLAENHMQQMQAVLAKAEDRLKQRDREIGRLKRKMQEWEAKSKNQECLHKKELQQKRHDAENSEYLYRRCLMLEHKIYEMEKFLADYGLVWVGETKDTANAPKQLLNDYIGTCYAQIAANIEQLNLAVGKGEVHVHRNHDGGGATFKTPSCMSLKFYKNGLVVQEGPLRPYTDPTASSFIRDILDGYFPSELQQTYPNGVPFKVEDHRTEIYVGFGAGFPGHGYRLGKQSLSFRDRSPTTSARRQETTSVGSSRCSTAQRENFYSIDPTVPFIPTSSPRSTNSKSRCETPPLELSSLRSQILASHNNNCSDFHLQSHVNAELGIRKDTKREMATTNTRYHISMKDRPTKKNVSRSSPSRLRSGSGTSRQSLTDRSSSRLSSSRLDGVADDARSRSRSASLSGGRFKLRSFSGLRIPAVKSTASTSNYSNDRGSATKPRITRSATLDRKNAPPLIRQINEPTGKLGELRVKVRSLNGGTVFLVHVCADDTVARLYQILDAAMSKSRSKGYKIVISGYTPKRLEQLGVSLREYGIARDSVLHLVDD